MSDQDLTRQLKHLIRGLWLPSETEAPWTVPSWTLQDLDPAAMRHALRRDGATPVVEISLDDLMAQIERRCRGYGDEGVAIASQHRALATFLSNQCDRIQVFRIGEVTVDILIIGQTADRLLIVQTQSVET
jgi:hypothetical protein